MFHVVLVGLAASLLFMSWHLVRLTPRATSMFLSSRGISAIGVTLLILGTSFAYLNSQEFKDPAAMLASFVLMIVGVWLMLAPSSGQRGSYRDEEMLRRLFGMLGVLFGVLIAGFYAPQMQLVAVFNLLLVTVGFWVTTNYLGHLDRGR